jgi:hypothetical protein
MSLEMSRVKEILEEIINEFNSSRNKSKEELLLKLEVSQRLVVHNQTKIWLRTKSGKPMAEELLKVASNLLEKIKKEYTSEEIIILISQIESKIMEINEESQRRNMIVT